MHNEKLNIEINIENEIEDIRKKLYTDIDYGSYSNILATSQELDLIILKFIMTEHDCKNKLNLDI